jgi:hypothetical protein
VDAAAILGASAIDTAFDALARSYDHVVIDAGPVADLPLDRMAQIAPRAVLVAEASADVNTTAAHERLRAAGFADVTMLMAAAPPARAAA